jgi:hypothetical protein
MERKLYKDKGRIRLTEFIKNQKGGEKMGEIYDKTIGQKYVNHLKDYLGEAGVTIDSAALGKAVEQAQKAMGTCDQCTNGWHW